MAKQNGKYKIILLQDKIYCEIKAAPLSKGDID
jgi:hypothetical protein